MLLSSVKKKRSHWDVSGDKGNEWKPFICLWNPQSFNEYKEIKEAFST